VARPRITETTCLGAAYAAGLAVGFWPDQQALRDYWKLDREWKPAMEPAERDARYALWKKAVERTFDWA